MFEDQPHLVAFTLARWISEIHFTSLHPHTHTDGPATTYADYIYIYIYFEFLFFFLIVVLLGSTT